MELFLPSCGGAVHHRRHRSVPTSVPSCHPRAAGEEEEETEHVDICGCELSKVVNTGEADREGQRLGVNLRVPMETQRDGKSEDASETEHHGGGEAVDEDQLESPRTASTARIPGNVEG